MGWPFLMSCLQVATKRTKLVQLLAILYVTTEWYAPGVRVELLKHGDNDDICDASDMPGVSHCH